MIFGLLLFLSLCLDFSRLADQGMSTVLESRQVMCNGLEHYAAASFRKAWKIPTIGAIALFVTDAISTYEHAIGNSST
jgi:hypothetical protein